MRITLDANHGFRVCADDWNERFQRLLDVADSDPALASAKYAALEQLAREFVAVATRHAELIVAEQGLPERLRTIPATNLGGQAGGTKFVRGGILYKLARDAEVWRLFFRTQRIFVV
jgi:hypothetical protein